MPLNESSYGGVGVAFPAPEGLTFSLRDTVGQIKYEGKLLVRNAA